MHDTQQKLLDLSKKQNISKLSLREMGKLIGMDNTSPQIIKHHLIQLQKKGHLRLNNNINLLETIKKTIQSQTSFTKIPVLGLANCGQATLIANEEISGYLQISSRIIGGNSKNMFAVQAKGDSMNLANIDGNNIEEDDYIIVDSNIKTLHDNEYVLSIIDNCANVKKFIKDKKNNQIILVSESTNQYPPIVISESDSYLINGKVISIIKTGQHRKN